MSRPSELFPWFCTAHARQRGRERHIGESAIACALGLADLRRPLADGKFQLGFSRRIIRRAGRDPALVKFVRIFERLVLVVAENGAVVTVWRDRRRRCHPSARRGDPEAEGEIAAYSTGGQCGGYWASALSQPMTAIPGLRAAEIRFAAQYRGYDGRRSLSH